jgi:hypothetical protein
MIFWKPMLVAKDLSAIAAGKIVRVLADEGLVAIGAALDVGILRVRVKPSSTVAAKHETFAVVLTAVRAYRQEGGVKPLI